MFDLGFSEIILIAVIALVVLGPERLPKVARTAGRILGKIRSFVMNAKQDLSTQINFQDWQELNNTLRRDMEDSIHNLEQKFSQMRNDLGDTAWQRLPEMHTPEDFAQKSMFYQQHRRRAIQKRRQNRMQMMRRHRPVRIRRRPR